MKSYKFVREGKDWFIDLPEYIEQGGTKTDLQMVEGADIMLNIVSNGADSVCLILDRDPFPGSSSLKLIERCDPYVGGGYYLLQDFEGKVYNHQIWLCAVTDFVFGDIPENIFVKRTGG